ncbi:putative ABC transporter ATP-binding protein YbhF [compost metagenome]
MSIIRVDNLTKVFDRPIRSDGLKGAISDLFKRQYEQKIAVNGLSFEIEKGEMVGYLGPNGAGKSTSIKMLVGILVPTSGTVQVGGIEPHSNRTKNAKRIGVVFGQRSQLWWDIPVSETLQMMKYMYKIPEQQFKKNIELFTDILGIQEFMNVAVRQLSLGQRMRADLCASLMHNPEILYLDEPTIGLDVVVKEKIRQFLHEINRTQRTTILLTTHDMADIEKLCSRVIIINHGKKVYDGMLDRLRNEYGSGEVLSVSLEGTISFEREIRAIGAERVEWDEEKHEATIYYNRQTVSSATILQFLMNKDRIIDFEVRPNEIEDIIREIYSEKEMVV